MKKRDPTPVSRQSVLFVQDFMALFEVECNYVKN